MKFLYSCKSLLFRVEAREDVSEALMACIYLGIDGKVRIPRFWRNNLANTIPTSLGPNLFHVLEGISPLLLCWAVCWSFLDTMRPTFLLKRFADRGRLVAPFDRGQVQRRTTERAEWRMGVRWVIPVGIDFGFWFRCCAICRAGPYGGRASGADIVAVGADHGGGTGVGSRAHDTRQRQNTS
jgi:hypothetical protein